MAFTFIGGCAHAPRPLCACGRSSHRPDHMIAPDDAFVPPRAPVVTHMPPDMRHTFYHLARLFIQHRCGVYPYWSGLLYNLLTPS
ncbi:hypothetical protein GDO81_019443 [Engystomops pustulosus]|uniref:Uncharacterized protein n=1 Tax=Engystomops pustulosus TaxID=76066 RepID=A0AAV6YW64_ENGPU|nr:hypothetical protein GDO81_019443 [Engystomops pustulosus]